MPNFHHHPDGYLYIRTATGTYIDTPENFALDLGQPYSGLPEGYNERFYEPGVKHFLGTHTMSTPQPLEWTEGDRYISMISDLLAAKAARE